MKKINGPTNVIRMEGSINGIKKIIYFFMDVHVPYEYQTDCNDPDNSIDIVEYFRNNFIKLKNINKTYDFFLETTPELIIEKVAELYPEPKLKYIRKVGKFFYESIRFDASKNKLSSLFKNVRLHYIDIRTVILYHLFPILDYAISQLEENIKGVHRIVEGSLVAVIELTDIILSTLKNKELPEKKINMEAIKKFNTPFIPHRQEYYDHLIYLMNKFLHGYTNSNIKKIIYRYIDLLIPEIEAAFIFFLNLYEESKKLNYESYQNESIKNKFIVAFRDMKNIFFTYRFAILVDLYFLRRFLDKKYITNVVVYSGAFHSVTCIYILNSIGFKITHCANCVIQDMIELNNVVAKISNFPSIKSIFELFHIFEQPIDNTQCSDLSEFPELFE